MSCNSSLLFFIGCWIVICSVMTVGQVTCFRGNNYESDLAAAKYLDRQIKAIIDYPYRWPAVKNSNTDGMKEYAGANDRRLSKFIEGLFDVNYRKASKSAPPPSKSQPLPGGRRRVTIRPNGATTRVTVGNNWDDVAAGRSGLQMTATAAFAGTTAVPAERRVFDNEYECTSANDGRPCVCYTTDFLDSLGQLLDEAVVQDDMTAAAVAFACPSYKVVPPTFVVSYSSATAAAVAVVETTTVHLGQNSTGTNINETAAATVPANKEVDFDYIVNYKLEKSNDGK